MLPPVPLAVKRIELLSQVKFTRLVIVGAVGVVLTVTTAPALATEVPQAAVSVTV